MTIEPTEPTTPRDLREAMPMPDLGRMGSFDRPRALMNWFFSHFGDKTPNDIEPHAAAFWGSASEWWPSMDSINHAEMAQAFDMFTEHWELSLLHPDCAKAWRYLPSKTPMTIYRGQGADDPVGLAWTRDRAKAEWFARNGMRGAARPRPAVLTATLWKHQTALAFNDRSEREVVPFSIPDRYSIELLT